MARGRSSASGLSAGQRRTLQPISNSNAIEADPMHAKVLALPHHDGVDAVVTAGWSKNTTSSMGPGRFLRYSQRWMAAWAKPSGWRAALRPNVGFFFLHAGERVHDRRQDEEQGPARTIIAIEPKTNGTNSDSELVAHRRAKGLRCEAILVFTHKILVVLKREAENRCDDDVLGSVLFEPPGHASVPTSGD